MSSGTYPCPCCGIVRAARNAVALCRDCADTDPTWGQPVDYDDEPSPWADMVRGVAVDSTGWGYLPGHAPIYVGLDGA